MRRPDRLLLAGALMILAQLLFRGWALWGSWFYFDDLAFMSRALNQPFGADYLFESYGGHLMPAGFAIAWVLTKWAVFDWAPWAAVILALQLIASIGVFRLLLSMFGRRPVVLVLLAGYLAWVFTLPAGVWFAAGINQIPLQIALAFGLTAHLAYLRTHRVRHLVVALLWVAAGLLFYEKTILVLGIYGLVALCWFSTGKTPQRLRGLWDSYRVGVIVYVVLGAAYLAIYAHWGLNFSPGETADVSWGPIAWNLVGIAMSSALVGGPIEWQSLNPGGLADPADAVLVISWAAVAGIVYYGWRSRMISKRAWSLLAFTTIGNVALLASARAGVVGPEIAREYRYQSEAALVAVLSIGLAFLPLIGAREPNTVREDAPAGYEGRRTVAAVGVVVAALSIFSSVRYVALWQDDNPSRDYLDTVESSLDEASADGPVPLVNDGVPQAILWSFRYPENTYQHLFKPWSDKMVFPTSAIDDIYVFDDDGKLTRARLVPARQMVEPKDADASTKDCPYPLDRSPVTVPLDGPVIGTGWWVTVDYDADVVTPVRVVAGDEAYDLDLPAGEHTLWVQASGTFRSVVFKSFPDDSGTCVTDLELGTPSPLPDLGKDGDSSDGDDETAS
ncbi:hypothetical protein [Nocardioides mangrovi]|uniref:Uncharacterized protein n=1 Tax=Nocardioides mangrovi TaxID=2874580 RepID=A0ABS7U7Q6_9ACTN|nr:hypothetical protein [Nocardioides mangrovi]MBZ5736882.1 hypothetical protein [Nocardioides mangrovi]